MWNHERSYSFNGGAANIGLKSLSTSGLDTDLFREFAEREVALWKEIYLDYLSMGSSMLVVHYEDMKEDMAKQVRSVTHRPAQR